MNPKKQAILDKGLMTEEELTKAIKAKVDSGDARNENSALMKIYRDVSIQDGGMTEIGGYWLQAYERNDGTVSGYLLTADGAKRVGNLDKAPQPKDAFELFQQVKFTEVTLKKNVFTGSEWLEASSKTKTKDAKLGYTVDDCLGDISDVKEGGMYVLGGHVRFVNLVGIFKDGEKVGDEPILDQGKVNLRLVIENSNGDQINVKIPDELRLETLIDGDDFGWLSEPDAVKELADMLLHEDVVVFGQCSKFFSEGRKDERELEKPYASLTNFGFVVLAN